MVSHTHQRYFVASVCCDLMIATVREDHREVAELMRIVIRYPQSDNEQNGSLSPYKGAITNRANVKHRQRKYNTGASAQ